DAQVKVAQLFEDLAKANQKIEEKTLRAPVDGKVQQLAVFTVGGVATAAQPVMVIVPADSRLEIEAMVSNRDIGFVEPGQPAEIKVDTFDFTRFGLLRGIVLNVSKDAIVRDKPANKTSQSQPVAGTLANSSEPEGQELVYSARVSLDATNIQVLDKLV